MFLLKVYENSQFEVCLLLVTDCVYSDKTPSGILIDVVTSLKAALVVDPVMVSTSGDVLAGPSILAEFRYAKLYVEHS